MKKEETFIERLERLIDDKGISQKQIAETVGISSNGISTWKVSGAYPRADIAVKLARALGVTTEYLITGEISGLEKQDTLAIKIAALSENKRRVVQAVIDSLEIFSA